MQSRKQLEDFFYNHNDEKTVKSMQTQEIPHHSKWSKIYRKMKQTSLKHIIKK